MVKTTPLLRTALQGLLPALAVCALGSAGSLIGPGQPAQDSEKEKAIEVQYLEIVTPDVDATCDSLEALHGVEFSDPVPNLGNARTAPLEGGGMIGVRGPMRPDEAPVVRPYLLTDDIDVAAKSAQEAGGKIAMPPMPIPELGKFSIYILGGIDYGLWEI